MATGFGAGPNEPWALESTLKRLEDLSKDQVKLLNALASARGADTRGLVTSINTGSSTTKADTSATEENTKAAMQLSASMSGAMSKLNSVTGASASSVIGRLGSDLGGLSEILGKGKMGKLAAGMAVTAEAFNILWTRTTKLADATFGAYDAGIVFTGGMHQLADSASELGLNVDDFGKVIMRNSQVVAVMGIKRTTELGKAFKEATNGGISLGMTFDQAQETLLSYAEQQRYTGNLNKMSTQEVVQGAVEYGKQLNMLSQITGKRREQIDSEIKEHLKAPNVQLFLNSLAPEIRKNATENIKNFEALGSELGPAFQRMITQYQAGGLGAMDERDLAFLRSGNNIEKFEKLYTTTLQGTKEEQLSILKDMGQTAQQSVNENVTNFGRATGAYRDSGLMAQQFATSVEALTQAQTAAGQGISPDAAGVKDAQQKVNSALNTMDNSLSDLAAQGVSKFADKIGAAGTAAQDAADGLRKLAAYTHGDLAPTKEDFEQMAKGVGIAAAAGILGSGVIGSIVTTVMGAGAAKTLFSKVGLAGAVGAEGAATGAAAAGAESLVGKLVKGGKLSVGGIVGGLVLDQATDALKESGHEKLGAVTDIGSEALTYAGYGGLLGSVVPGLGTGIGGLVGGAVGTGVGLYKNWSNLFGSSPAAGSTDPNSAENQLDQSNGLVGGAVDTGVSLYTNRPNLLGGSPAAGSTDPNSAENQLDKLQRSVSATGGLSNQINGAADNATNTGGNITTTTTGSVSTLPIATLSSEQKHKQMIDALNAIKETLDSSQLYIVEEIRVLRDGFARANGTIY